VLDFAEAAAHPHNAGRRTYTTDGGLLQPGPAPRFLGTPSAVPAPAPVVGRHTAEVLAEAGLDAAAVAALREQQVVGGG
jgi:alpha-methylacyl-CoA racemase